MFEAVFAALGFAKASLYYLLLISWKTGRFITVAAKFLWGWLCGVVAYFLATLQVIFEDFQPFAADILAYFHAIVQGLCYVKNGLFNVFFSIYSVLSASVNWGVSLAVQTFAELTNAVLSVTCGVSETFAFLKRLLVLFGSGVWFLFTLIPLSVISLFVYSTYCLGLLFHEISNATAAFFRKISGIYEFITDVPAESVGGLFVVVCLLYIFVRFQLALCRFFYEKYTVFVEIVRRKVVGLRGCFRGAKKGGVVVSQRGSDEEDVNEENFCIVCRERVKNVLLLPCKHVCVCNYCEVKLNRHDSRCPVCRTHVHRTMKVFI